jgi:hypothetical protein
MDGRAWRARDRPLRPLISSEWSPSVEESPERRQWLKDSTVRRDSRLLCELKTMYQYAARSIPELPTAGTGDQALDGLRGERSVTPRRQLLFGGRSRENLSQQQTGESS